MSTYGAGQPVPTLPVCPRHPDRVTYVRCQRCNRPVCPQCQRPAAVGVQCVDCVNEARKEAPGMRSVLGAPVRQGMPVITIAVIAICVVMFICQQLLKTPFDIRFSLVPGLVGAEPYRLITSMFMHVSIIHLLMNMYALWVVGSYLERMLGRLWFSVLFLLSGLAGGVAVVAWARFTEDADLWRTMTMGASGAIFGCFGAILLVSRRLGHNAQGILAVIAINVVFSFVVANISWQGHLGGLVGGLAMGALYAYAPRKYRALLSAGGSIVFVALLALVTVLATRPGA